MSGMDYFVAGALTATIVDVITRALEARGWWHGLSWGGKDTEHPGWWKWRYKRPAEREWKKL